MRFAVVGHVEYIDFVRVPRVPRQGEIAHASEAWGEAAGGGAVAAVQLANLASEASLFTGLSTDELGQRSRVELEGRGVTVYSRPIEQPQRRGVTFIDDERERTITVIGEKLSVSGADGELPWDELDEADGVYFVSGDVEALRQARRARVLVATTRVLPTLQAAGVALDAVVGSATDEGERYTPGDLTPEPGVATRTEGARGGFLIPGGRWEAAPLPGPLVDSYGCGDCFAAGFLYALAEGMPAADAAAFGARCGAATATGRGPYTGQLRL